MIYQIIQESQILEVYEERKDSIALQLTGCDTFYLDEEDLSDFIEALKLMQKKITHEKTRTKNKGH